MESPVTRKRKGVARRLEADARNIHGDTAVRLLFAVLPENPAGMEPKNGNVHDCCTTDRLESVGQAKRAGFAFFRK